MRKEEQPATMGHLTSVDQRFEIISSYGRILERYSSPVGREADLPYPKAVIRKAIYEELCENPDSEQRSFLEMAFVQLECFLPTAEFKVLYDFKRASTRAQELARSGRPNDIVASANILSRVEGERAVGILEAISKKIRQRKFEIRALKLPLFSSRAC